MPTEDKPGPLDNHKPELSQGIRTTTYKHKTCSAAAAAKRLCNKKLNWTITIIPPLPPPPILVPCLLNRSRSSKTCLQTLLSKAVTPTAMQSSPRTSSFPITTPPGSRKNGYSKIPPPREWVVATIISDSSSAVDCNWQVPPRKCAKTEEEEGANCYCAHLRASMTQLGCARRDLEGALAP